MTSTRAPHGVTDERTARLAWARIAEPTDTVARKMIERFGLEEAFALAARGGRTPSGEPIDRFAARVAQLDLAREQHITERVGARVLLPEDPEWPSGMDDLAMPPWCLWVRGSAPLTRIGDRSVAIVGARASTAYGNHVAGELGAGTAGRGFVVVSGAAFGIDAAAHRGALAVDGSTVAVLAGGVDRAYPTAHTDLLEQIARSGAVVSEVPPGSAPTRVRFLARNRVIAALATGTVVVEAGLRSGALNTLRQASELGRPVAAVPGPVTSMVSAGCHYAVRAYDATLVTDTDEVVDLLGRIGGADMAPDKRGPRRPWDGLAVEAERVWGVLAPYLSKTVEELAVQAGLSTTEVLSALGELQLRGLAEQRLDGWGRCPAR